MFQNGDGVGDGLLFRLERWQLQWTWVNCVLPSVDGQTRSPNSLRNRKTTARRRAV